MPASRPEEPKEKAPTALGPVVQVGKSRILTGTCSWTDPTLLKETDWYPKKTMTAANRLAYYAAHFPLVEADSTYYRPPGEQLTRGWAANSPPGFSFNIKAYSLFTQHPTQPESLWPDLHEGIKPEFAGKRRLYADHLDPDALDEAWDRFDHALGPLREAGKLGAVLMQYPAWFTPKRANRTVLERLPGRLPGTRICVEFRSPRWLADDDRDRTVALLSELDLALVVLDAPKASGLETVAAVTSRGAGRRPFSRSGRRRVERSRGHGRRALPLPLRRRGARCLGPPDPPPGRRGRGGPRAHEQLLPGLRRPQRGRYATPPQRPRVSTTAISVPARPTLALWFTINVTTPT